MTRIVILPSSPYVRVGLFGCNFCLDVACITLPKQQALQLPPDLLESPVLGKDISWVLVSINMIETDHLAAIASLTL